MFELRERGRREPWEQGRGPVAEPGEGTRDRAVAAWKERAEGPGTLRRGLGALCGRGSRWEWSARRGFKGKRPPAGNRESLDSGAGAEELRTLGDHRK